MATFQDNINIIQNAIYGKEMRPAISEALTQSWGSVKIMMGSVDQLNARVDNLPGSIPGGGTDVDGGIIIHDALPPSTLIVYGGTTSLESVGNSTLSSA